MATTTNYGWETPDNTDAVTNGALAMRTLAGEIDASLADLQGGTTGQLLSKTSNDDMAFTWTAPPSTDSLIPKSIIDAAGDLIIGTAADTPARLAVGTNGQVLTSNGTTAAWATPSGGGFTLIESKSLSAQSSVTFTDIPQTYNELRVEVVGASGSAYIGLRVGQNGIYSGNSYEITYKSQIQTTIGSTNTSATGFTGLTYAAPCIWRIPFYKSQASTNGMYIMNGLQANYNVWGQVASVTAAGGGYATALNQLQVYIASGTFSAGTAYLYGVK